jgi:hypothetical protein
VARVVPPGCGYPGCLHHYYRPRPECICVARPDGREGVHLLAANPLCRAHHTVLELIEDAADVLCMR